MKCPAVTERTAAPTVLLLLKMVSFSNTSDLLLFSILHSYFNKMRAVLGAYGDEGESMGSGGQKQLAKVIFLSFNGHMAHF